MRLVTPERWYVGFWLLAASGFLAAEYFVIKWAVMAAYMQLMIGVR